MGSNNDGLWNEKGAIYSIDSFSLHGGELKLLMLFMQLTFVSTLYGLRRFELKRREQKTKTQGNMNYA